MTTQPETTSRDPNALAEMSVINVEALSTDLVMLAIVTALDDDARDTFRDYIRRVIQVIEGKHNLSEVDRQALVAKMKQWIAR